MVKIKEKLVKLLAVAFVGTMPILGVSNIACAKGSEDSKYHETAYEDIEQLERGLDEVMQSLAEVRQSLAEVGQRTAQAAYELGEHYMAAGEQNEVLRCYQQAAEGGHAQAQFCLGEHYRFAGEQNRALMWYQRAAAQGHVGAQRILTVYRENGNIFPSALG